MKLTVLGLWHLGSVTAACCARHFQVTGLDFDPAVIAGLTAGRAPLHEPGLDALLGENLAAGRLRFSTDPAVCRDTDVLWVTFDTPVNDADESDATQVLEPLRRALAELPPGALVLVSAQLPVGTCADLEREFPQFHWACSPENLRLGRALAAFSNAERIIVGTRSNAPRPLLETLLAPFSPNLVFMRTESAEMVKHALNSFLAASITFINEVARVCEHVGADAAEVSTGLRSEPRIGARAYLGAGGPFAGGTLARDVVTLSKLGARFGESLSVIPAIKQSNDLHRGWILRRLHSRFGDLHGRTFAVLGLTYTPDTDTLRRSAAVELCQQLLAAGARVQAHDPAVGALPVELAAVRLGDLRATLAAADAAVICTEWPQFRTAPWTELLPLLGQPVIVDANRFLEKALVACGPVEHLSVGRAA
ncbi:MAG: nucleotide sugar dehydrogenase [Chthoniobacter sp.]|nr:nucleotide sugar dehydrogenase [Chthoniobacter sp.]